MDNNFNANELNVVEAPQQTAPVSKKTAIVSMALGIASICLCELGIISLVCAIIGLNFHKKFVNKNNGNEIAFSRTGKITSTVGLILSIICIVVCIVFSVLLIVVCVKLGPELANQLSNTDINSFEEFIIILQDAFQKAFGA